MVSLPIDLNCMRKNLNKKLSQFKSRNVCRFKNIEHFQDGAGFFLKATKHGFVKEFLD